MPFLRRRGNTPIESNTKREDLPTADDTGLDATSMPQPSNHADDADADAATTASNGYRSRASSASRPETPSVQEQERNRRHKRFSVLRFRNASDPQLSLRVKQQAEKPPPVPRPPEIITTAPTGEFTGPRKKTSRLSLAAARLRRSHDIPRDADGSSTRPQPQLVSRKSFADDKGRTSLATLEEPPLPRPSLQSATGSSGISLPAMPNRQSESSRSDVSSNDRQSHQSPATTPRKSPASTTFFKLRRPRKAPEPLFPLSHLPQQKDKPPPAASSSSPSLDVASTPRPSSVRRGKIPPGQTGETDNTQRAGPSPAAALLGQGGGPRSGQSSPTRPKFLRGRSSTMSSMGRDSTDDHLLPPTTRTSTSTGRKSFGDLIGLSRMRQNSELSRQGTLSPATPASGASKSNSLQISRESITLPERRDDESPVKYLARIEEIVSRGVIAATLSKGSDPFSAAVLRSYMRRFSFFGDPMDMALRKLLMEAELPKETQHIDRCLEAFANRYHECNPGIYSSPDQAYFIAFSLLILHTDVFNKNNKYKMQKPDYLKNTREQGVYDDILECFYDNITYTPFIHLEDELDMSGGRGNAKSTKRKQLLGSSHDAVKRAAKEPIDPYTLIIDGKLDLLRPSLKDAMLLEEHYNYLGSATALNLKDLQKTFFRTGVLQIVSARSRPDAFMTEKTVTNPDDAGPGIVDIKVTKVGLLWRKDVKKRKTRSPWQEWGAILTGAQLYFFRNTSWVKSLMHQYEGHIKSGNDGIPLIFKPPLEEFKPDALMSTHGAVALHDTAYKKHKNAFVYVRQGGLDEVLLADSEDEMNDWLAKLNYAAAFRTSGVRMRGVGGYYDGQGRRGIRRLDNSDATQLVDTPTGQVSIARGRIDQKMAQDIQTARRDFMQQKIEEAEEKVKAAQRELDEQLRNARHLQILAPIQPRTREQILTAAGRMSARLKWTRMDIWRERCHLDILMQDLEEDVPGRTLSRATPLKHEPSQSSHDGSSSPTSRAAVSRNESKAKQHRKSTQKPKDLQLQDASSAAEQEEHVGGSPMEQDYKTPPQSATFNQEAPYEPSRTMSDESGPEGPVASIPTSTPGAQEHTPRAKTAELEGAQAEQTPSRDHSSQDDVDADERDLLRQAGLLDAMPSKAVSDKSNLSTAGDGAEQASAADREKHDKNKIRRSLQRTLREGAGHLSHHRSKRGREGQPAASSEETNRDSMLSRGTGSFVVHGKKASVINFGSELQIMSNDEKLRFRKQSQQVDQSLSPTLSQGEGDDDDDFYSAAGDLADSETTSRRESAASASTATARSFRELHRKYSSAHASRSVSNSRRLAVPSDGESEAAVSFSDGRRSPLPPIETEEEEEGDKREGDLGGDDKVKENAKGTGQDE